MRDWKPRGSRRRQLSHLSSKALLCSPPSWCGGVRYGTRSALPSLPLSLSLPAHLYLSLAPYGLIPAATQHAANRHANEPLFLLHLFFFLVFLLFLLFALFLLFFFFFLLLPLLPPPLTGSSMLCNPVSIQTVSTQWVQLTGCSSDQQGACRASYRQRFFCSL